MEITADAAGDYDKNIYIYIMRDGSQHLHFEPVFLCVTDFVGNIIMLSVVCLLLYYIVDHVPLCQCVCIIT